MYVSPSYFFVLTFYSVLALLLGLISTCVYSFNLASCSNLFLFCASDVYIGVRI